jgi:hypothetical protein
MMRVAIRVCLFFIFYLLGKIYHYYLKSLRVRLSDYPTSHDYAISQILKILLVSQYKVGLGRNIMEAACRIRGWSGKFGVAAPPCKGLQFINYCSLLLSLKEQPHALFCLSYNVYLGFRHITDSSFFYLPPFSKRK